MYKRILSAFLASALVLSTFINLPVSAATQENVIYVSPTGNDATGNGTQASPYQTIQKANEVAKEGDTILLAEGVYRETVVPNQNHITYQSAEGASAVISGADSVTGFSPVEGEKNIYVADFVQGSDLTNDEMQVFVEGTMAYAARWPNMTSDNTILTPTLATMDSGTKSDSATKTATVVDQDLPDGIDLNGAKLVTAGGAAYNTWQGTVQEYNFQEKTLAVTGTPGADYMDPKAGNEYYLYGKKELLDTDGEWWYDAEAQKLYLYSSQGAPENVEVKQRKFVFDLSGRTGITLKNLSTFAGIVVTDSSSKDILIDTIEARYLSHTNNPGDGGKPGFPNNGFEIAGQNIVLQNSLFQYSATSLLSLVGKDNYLINCQVLDGNYLGTYSASVNVYGENVVISNNTISRSGRTCIGANQQKKFLNALIQYNDISHAAMLTDDTAALYFCNVDGADADGNATEIRYNKVHDMPEGICAGIYTDNQTSNFFIHHNVIWNTSGTLQLNVPSNSVLAINNTCIDDDEKVGQFGGTLFKEDTFGTRFYNNIFTGVQQDNPANNFRSEDKCNYWNAPLSLFVDPSQNDYRLKEGCEAINTGLMISGVTSDAIGAPDIGAYEYDPETGECKDFEVGCNPEVVLQVSDIDLSRNDTGLQNMVKNGTFSYETQNWITSGTVTPIEVETWGTEDALARLQSKSLSLDNASKIEQVIQGLEPNTEYTFRAWTKSSKTIGEALIQVKDYGGAPLQKTANSTIWSASDLVFTTDESGKATISIENTLPAEGAVVGDPVDIISNKLVTTPVYDNTYASKTDVVDLGSDGVSFVQNALDSTDKRVSFRFDTQDQEIQIHNDPARLKLIVTVDGNVQEISRLYSTYINNTDPNYVYDYEGADMWRGDALTPVKASQVGFISFDLSQIEGNVEKVELQLFFGGYVNGQMEISTYGYNDWDNKSLTYENLTQYFPTASQALVYVDDLSVVKNVQNDDVTDRMELISAINLAMKKLASAQGLISNERLEEYRNVIETAKAATENYKAAKDTLDQATRLFEARLALESQIVNSQTSVKDMIGKMNDPNATIEPEKVFNQSVEEAVAVLNQADTNIDALGNMIEVIKQAEATFTIAILPPVSTYRVFDLNAALKDKSNWTSTPCWSPVPNGGFSESEAGYQFDNSYIHRYIKEKCGADTILEVNLTFEDLGVGWPGFVLRSQAVEGEYNAQANYLVIVKGDVVEAQKYYNSQQIYNKTFANGVEGNRPITNRTTKLQMGAVDTMFGVRYFLYADGVAIFDFIDTDANVNPIAEGYVGIATTGLENDEEFQIAPVLDNTSISSVKLNGISGTIKDDQIYIALSDKSEIPVSGEDFEIVTASAKSVLSTPVSEDGGTTWRFTVTAEDKVTVKEYTISLSVPVDEKESLKKLYDEYAQKINDNYTSESWQAFQDALSKAKSVLDNEHATAQEIAEAEELLKKAFEALEKQPDSGSNPSDESSNTESPATGESRDGLLAVWILAFALAGIGFITLLQKKIVKDK